MDIFRKIAKKIRHLIMARIYAPRVRQDVDLPTVQLGSTYGGWAVVDTPNLQGATIISCGLGEDASFDVEFAARFKARVLIVDPTPRAIQHFVELVTRLGQPNAALYVRGGKQPVNAYDLSTLTESNLVLVPKALWSSTQKIRFYAPKNPDHVSHSIVNFQNNYATDTHYIEVEAITIDALMAEFGMNEIPLMKLDIEGAEGQVISDMLAKGIRPQQLLVEFDELGMPSSLAKAKYETTDMALREAGYRLANFDGHTNFTYISERFASPEAEDNLKIAINHV